MKLLKIIAGVTIALAYIFREPIQLILVSGFILAGVGGLIYAIT